MVRKIEDSGSGVEMVVVRVGLKERQSQVGWLLVLFSSAPWVRRRSEGLVGVQNTDR